jgi:two-component system sensor kinase FixL
LRETQNYLENLINYANAPIIVWTPDLKITKFNHAFEHLTGRSTEEVLGKELSILFPEENCEQVLLEIKRTLSGNNWESVEIPILNKDGSIRVALWNSANIYAENGTTLTATIAQGVDITERKRAEKTLRESEERYKSLFKANIDGILIADPTTKKFRYANPAMCRMLGYSEEELTQMGVADIHPKESLEQVIAEFEALASGAKITAKDLLCVRKDGQVISVSINAGTVTINQTKYLLAIFRDITERRQAEEKLERSAKEWTSTFDSITDLISIQDKDFRYIRVNKSFADTFRMKPEEVVGKTCYELIHGTREPWPTCPHKRALDDGKAHREEFFEPKLGIHIEVSVSPLIDEKGEVVGTVHITKDITERKQAEEALRESEERYKSLFKANIDGILIADATTKKLRYANPAICRMLGYSEEEFTRMSVADIHPKESLEQVFAEFEAQASGAKINTELPCVRKDGQVVSMSINAGTVTINQTEYLLGVFRDTTERQQAEQRQAELLQQLEKVNQELKDFAYVVSHDLKAPLRGIKTIAEWISTDYADKLDDNGKEQMNLLASRVDRMHNLIDGILQYSRIGRIEEEKAVVNLNELVTEAIDMIAPPENITITIENELPTIECGQTRIMQVFQNLMSNAVEYMDKPQGQIKVGCVEEDGFWEFYVADNGPGIEEKYFEKIFQLFQTLAPRDGSESTGIGLTIIKKIVEMYGGKTWVQSKVGSGSTFFFTLPKQEMGVKDAKLEASIIG